MSLLIVGLMSGTSLDGIDAALVDFDGTDERDLAWKLLGFVTAPYRPEQRRLIHDAIAHGGPEALCELHAMLGEWFALATLAVCHEAGVAAIDVDLVGSHGQTIWHRPPTHGARGATLQLGDPATIAERTGISVVSDFRTRDVAAGGEGAPLVPWVDKVLFSLPERARVLQNIGGMANLTWVPPRGDAQPLLAFDTGPGNAPIDAAVERATNGAQTFDRDGLIAARGRVDEALLAELLAHPFFAQAPPKSTGREAFGSAYIETVVQRAQPQDDAGWSNLIATLTALSAQSIADACQRWLAERGFDELVITGGGARNPTLVRMIQERLAPTTVRTGDVLGIDPDAKEALAFAALAWAHVKRIPGNVPGATGAEGPRVLGAFTPGRGAERPVVR